MILLLKTRFDDFKLLPNRILQSKNITMTSFTNQPTTFTQFLTCYSMRYSSEEMNIITKNLTSLEKYHECFV